MPSVLEPFAAKSWVIAWALATKMPMVLLPAFWGPGPDRAA